MYIFGSNTGTFINCSFINNTATENGGAFVIHRDSILTLSDSEFSSNKARSGGAIFSDNTTLSITNSTFEANLAIKSGGALYMELSNATVQNTTIQSNNATEDCGGICATETSYIEASNVIIRYNLARNAGGGIGISNDSSILCYSCMISNNTALNGAGMHVSSNNSILVAAQLQNSMFENNSASLYGGGIVFVDPTNRGIRCDNPNITCSQIILLNTSFVNNFANRSGSAIISTHANGVLIDCNYRGQRNQGFLDQTNFSSLEQLDPRQLCKEWIENSLVSDEYAGIVGTYGQEIKLTISLEDNDVRLVGTAQTGYVLEELRLGMQLPMMNLTVVDGFGIGPVPTSPQSFIARLSSSDDLLFGHYLVNISDGSGHFSEVAISPSHGMYRLQINFEHQNLETIYVIVIVRACHIGEEFILELRACQECDAISYNFNPSEVGGCTQCPTTATCQGLYIVPNEGYWHKTPCHNTVKECLIEEACSYENRYGELMSFTNNLTDCNLNTTELNTYNEALCNEGYEGLLCGSCKKSFGLSARFLCLKCLSTILSLIIIIGISIYLLAAASFTIKGCLPSTLRPRNDPSTSNQVSNAPGPSNRNEHLNVERVKMLGKGHGAQIALSRQRERPNISQPETQTQAATQQENEYELTRWRTTEIFKIMMNFLQTTAVAANINVRWTNGALGMFESSEYIGVLTTVAISRPVDCIFSSSSASNRAIWRMLVSLFVPGLVVIILSIFWCFVAIKSGRGLRYLLKRCILSVISVTYISYLGLTKMAVRAFYCVDVYDSDDYSIHSKHKIWANDTSIKCYGRNHSGIIFIAVLVLTFVSVCFPLVSSIMLLRNKKRQRNRDIWIFETAGFLFRAFKDEFDFWESIVMFRKACLSIIVVFSYPLSGDSQGVLASVLLFFVCIFISL